VTLSGLTLGSAQGAGMFLLATSAQAGTQQKAAPAIVGVHGRRLCHHHVLILQVLLVERLLATAPSCLVVEDLVALTEIIIMLHYGLGWGFLRGRLRGR
jgi:hypothetical protein